MEKCPWSTVWRKCPPESVQGALSGGNVHRKVSKEHCLEEMSTGKCPWSTVWRKCPLESVHGALSGGNVHWKVSKEHCLEEMSTGKCPWSTVWRKCPLESVHGALSGGNVHRKVSMEHCLEEMSWKTFRGNVWIAMQDYKSLCIVPPWLTHRHTDSYTISSASLAKMVLV